MFAFISECIIPLLILGVVIAGTAARQQVYEEFTKGAEKGLKITAELLPTLIGLMVGVGALRASGILAAFCSFIGGFMKNWGIPAEVLPVAIIKLFSSSAATGLMIDIFSTSGADSYAGRLAALILSSTETLMYTVSLYFISVKITKTRWTVPGALVSIAAGIAASVFAVGWM